MAGKPDLVLGPDELFEGRLIYGGGLRVEGGRLQGEATLAGDVTIESGSNVEAKVSGENLVIRGAVSGGAAARGKLELAAGAALTGDVEVSSLSVEEGATLNGRVSMRPRA